MTSTSPHETIDLALSPPTVQLNPGRQYGDDTRQWQGIPGIERSRSGRLWATWYSGGLDEGPDNYVVLVTSNDDGATWSEPRLAIDPPADIRAFDPTLWIDPTGRMWLFWAMSKDKWDGRGGVWAITTPTPDDAEPVWSDPRRLCDGVMMNKPTALSSGEWLLPAPVWNTRCGVVESTDAGKTWQAAGGLVIPKDLEDYDEPMIVQRRDGSLWMLIRTKEGISESTSADGGKSWSALRPSGLPHPVTRFFVRRLSTGELLLVKHTVPGDIKERSHLTAHLSVDDGRTWTNGLLLDERKNVSYPDGIESNDGFIYIIYDLDRYGEREVLMTTFTRADIIAEKFVTPGARTRVVVNKAKRS